VSQLFCIVLYMSDISTPFTASCGVARFSICESGGLLAFEFYRIYSMVNHAFKFLRWLSCLLLVLRFRFWAKLCLKCRHVSVFKPQLS